MLLVDVMLPELSVLRANKIRRSGEGGKFVNLAEKAKPGDVVTVRIEDIGASSRKGAEGENADFFLYMIHDPRPSPPSPTYACWYLISAKWCVVSFTAPGVSHGQREVFSDPFLSATRVDLTG